MDYPMLGRAIPNLINLEKIIINIMNTIYETDVYDRIGPWDYALEFPYDKMRPHGVRQLNSLLLAVAPSKIKLKKLRAGSLSWKCFTSDVFIFKEPQIMRACESLTSLQLVLACFSDGLSGEEAPECYQFLEGNHRVRRFLTRLPHLESLKLYFHENTMAAQSTYPARLSLLIETGCFWPKLKKLQLGSFQTSESELLHLLERHASTLRKFSLHVAVELDAGGSW